MTNQSADSPALSPAESLLETAILLLQAERDGIALGMVSLDIHPKTKANAPHLAFALGASNRQHVLRSDDGTAFETFATVGAAEVTVYGADVEAVSA